MAEAKPYGILNRRKFIRTALVAAAGAAAPMLFLLEAEARAHALTRRAGGHPAAGRQPNQLAEPYAEACVMEAATATVIFEKDMNRPWPTASLAKMMLMLIVAEKLKDGSLTLTDRITTSANAAGMGGSQVYLKEGEVLPLQEMMHAIVVHSANDAAVAVAEYVAGSTEAFVQMMNLRAAALGLKNTRYYSVPGLPPAAGQQPDVSSACDLALLGCQLVKYPDVLHWSAIDTAPFRNGTFELRNTNHLIRTYPGCDGLKTGFYDKAGFNVVATAKRNRLRLIAVVLGSPRKEENFRQAATMMSQGFLNYEMHEVAQRGSPVARSLPVSGGAIGSITPVWGDDTAVFVKRADPKGAVIINYKLPASIAAPVSTGQQVGSAEIIAGGKSQQTIPLLAPAAVARGNLWQRLIDGL